MSIHKKAGHCGKCGSKLQFQASSSYGAEFKADFILLLTCFSLENLGFGMMKMLKLV